MSAITTQDGIELVFSLDSDAAILNLSAEKRHSRPTSCAFGGETHVKW